MKTILVPIDFSSAAQNALEYAVAMAKHTKSEITLLHVYRPPVVTSEEPIIYKLEDIIRDINTNLKKITDSVSKKHGKGVSLTYETRCGFPVQEIVQVAEDIKADLIIVGMHGADYLTEKIIGSVATSLMRKSKCPVLVINKKVKYKNIKNIVFASDYKEVRNKNVFQKLKSFAHLFGAHIHVLNVVPEKETMVTVSKAVAGSELNNSLKGVAHSFHTATNESIVDGINEFSKEEKADMIVMAPRDHNILSNVFSEPNSKKMAFHTHTPLLTLHE